MLPEGKIAISRNLDWGGRGLEMVVGSVVWGREERRSENRVAFADDQIRMFEEMTSKAAEAKVEEAIQYLKYVVTYYPSGTKQLQGSELDRIVERARANAIASMIDVLKRKTGKDLGDDPQNWIE